MMKIIWIVCLELLLTSCANMAPPAIPSSIPFEKREPKMVQIHSWTLQGKIAVQTAKDAGSATIDWSQHQRSYTIAMTGPLGANALHLKGKPGLVILTDSSGKQISASSPEELLANAWGFHLPVSNLNYWIRGLPVPGLPAKSSYDTSGHISELSQGGWTISYLSYTTVKGTDLPSRMSLIAPGMKVKLIIYTWKI